MKIIGFTFVALLLSAWALSNIAQAERHEEQLALQDGLIPAGTTFLTLDVTVDPQGETLGAYQFELTSENTSFTVVGVEAGEHLAFDHGRPPYFDPVAKQGETDRLILAEYARPGLADDQLPTQATRVATVHVMFTGPLHEHDKPAMTLKLTAAGNAAAKRIDAQISYSFRPPAIAPERPQ